MTVSTSSPRKATSRTRRRIIPHADHPDRWLDANGDPVVHASHPYDLERAELADILNFADRWGLELRIQSWSYYYPNKTTCVCLFPPELRIKRVQERLNDDS